MNFSFYNCEQNLVRYALEWFLKWWSLRFRRSIINTGEGLLLTFYVWRQIRSKFDELTYRRSRTKQYFGLNCCMWFHKCAKFQVHIYSKVFFLPQPPSPFGGRKNISSQIAKKICMRKLENKTIGIIKYNDILFKLTIVDSLVLCSSPK